MVASVRGLVSEAHRFLSVIESFWRGRFDTELSGRSHCRLRIHVDGDVRVDTVTRRVGVRKVFAVVLGVPLCTESATTLC